MDENKQMLDYLLKYVDYHMYQVEVVDGHTFIAFCKDEERGDIMFKIEALQVNRKNDSSNNGVGDDVTVQTNSKKED